MIGVGTFTVNDEMRRLVNVVLDSGRISYGPLSREFEAEFAAIHECKFGVLSNSGTSSLQVALQAMKDLYGWRDGDEIITQSVTFVATVNVVLHNRLKPVLVDIDECYGLNPELLEAAITEKTRAVIPVHLFGQPCNMQAIAPIARKYGLYILEDSCETMFASHRGRISWGDVACYSLYVAHLLTAGVGGIATTNDPDLVIKMRSLVNHGRDGIYLSIDDDDGLSGERLKEVVQRRFNFESVGHSYRVTELEAALALGQLDGWREMIRQRQENADYLTAELSDLEGHGWLTLPHTRRGTESARMMYPVVADTDKWALCGHLEGHGVETREMLRLTDQPAYRGLWRPEDYPMAEWVNKHGIYCGCHQGLTRADLDQIVDAFYSYGWGT
ncbi:MAG: DegT/DnrJ/EryC1/StrS family aminotransferase [Planctomycetaceae bacterium]|nr:MAG: DegT/DnrJ/EryC1/StrS family aminotransferase [Planctomycetaceae bacterium]